MTATAHYVDVLTRLKPGQLGLLRRHMGRPLDESVDGFDLFTGLWWPLRAQSPRVPRRAVAWLIAKLYAFRPLSHSPDETLPNQLHRCQPGDEPKRRQYQQRFDRLLVLPLDEIEPALRWALRQIDSKDLSVDWVKLTDDLSYWEHEPTRLKWAHQFLQPEPRS